MLMIMCTVLLVAGFIKSSEMMLLASGLFGIGASITYLADRIRKRG